MASICVYCSMKYERKSRYSKVGERGQVTIPKELRDRYGVRAGQEVVFEEHANGLLIKKVAAEDSLRALLGRIKRKLDVDRYLDDARGPRWTAGLDGQ